MSILLDVFLVVLLSLAIGYGFILNRSIVHSNEIRKVWISWRPNLLRQPFEPSMALQN